MLSGKGLLGGQGTVFTNLSLQGSGNVSINRKFYYI